MRTLRNGFRAIEGIALQRDGLARRVISEFRDYLGLKMSVLEAEDILINFFLTAEGDEDDRAVCFLALAYAEWNAGRLTERVKQKAIEIIDGELSLTPWYEACSVPVEQRGDFLSLVFGKEYWRPLYFIGFALEDTAADRQKDIEEEKEGIYKLALGLSLDEAVSLPREKAEYSQNVAHIFALDKTPEQKLAMRKKVLQELKEQILSPMSKPKNFPKPKYPTSYGKFSEGDVLVLRIQGGAYEGYCFVVQVLGKSRNEYFMARDDLGVSYRIFGSFFDYFSTVAPTQEDLFRCSPRPHCITKNHNKHYYQYIWQFEYDEEKINAMTVAQYADADYKGYVQMQEVKLRLADGGGGCRSCDLTDCDKIAAFLSSEIHVTDYDKNDEAPRITPAEKIAARNKELAETSAHLYEEKEMNFDTFTRLCEEDFLTFCGKQTGLFEHDPITIDEIDTCLMRYDRIDKLQIGDLRQDTCRHLIKTYGDRIRCLRISGRNTYDYSILGELKSLIFLAFGGSRRNAALWDMSGNDSLEGLYLGGFTQLRTLDGIEQAPKLKHLSISCEASMESVGALKDTKLESLDIWVNKITDCDVMVFEKMPHLRRLDFRSNFLTTEEIAYLVARRPDITGRSLRAVYAFSADSQDVFICGKGKPRLDRQKDAARILRYQEAFDKLVEQYKKF